LGESHQGIIYIPPSLPAGIRVPVIYLADGDTPHYAPILEAAIRDGRSAPAIIVGIEPGQGPVKGCTTPCDRRMLEYVIDLNPEGPLADDPFGRYLRFVTDELIPYVESRYPASSRREDRVTAGYSNGGAWALAAAEARPDLFGKVLAMSSVSKAVIASVSRLKNVRVYAGDGLLEGGSHRTPQTAAAAKRAGADVKFRQFVAGHSTMLFDMLFSEGISWLLPAPPRR
jgi:enterochelin esterase-like enzyme